MKGSVLEHHWESADGKKMTIQMVIPCSKVKEVLAEMHGGTFEGHRGAKKDHLQGPATLLTALKRRRREVVSTV